MNCCQPLQKYIYISKPSKAFQLERVTDHIGCLLLPTVWKAVTLLWCCFDVCSLPVCPLPLILFHGDFQGLFSTEAKHFWPCRSDGFIVFAAMNKKLITRYSRSLRIVRWVLVTRDACPCSQPGPPSGEGIEGTSEPPKASKSFVESDSRARERKEDRTSKNEGHMWPLCSLAAFK